MKSEFLHELMAGVKKEDLIGFSGSGEPAADARELIMAATVVSLVLENMVLNARIAILNREASPDTQLV